MRQLRATPSDFELRSGENGEMILEGYFAVYNSDYVIAPDMSESIAEGAFTRTINGGDIRALINHDTTLVLGRTKSNTLELREDSHGLFGRVVINPNDKDATNLYARVQRGDVDGCSIGFEIPPGGEDSEVRADGSVHWTIKDIDLYEVSACTFPAYQATNISARSAERDDILRHRSDAWKERMKERLNHYGFESPCSSKED